MITKKMFPQHWDTVSLGEVVEFLDHLRIPIKSSERKHGIYPYYGANGVQGFVDDFIFDEPLVLLAEDGGHFGNFDRTIAYMITGKSWVNNHAHVLRPKENINVKYLCRVLEKYDVRPFVKGATRAKLSKTDASRIPLPLPPLPIQKQIAALLEKADNLRQQSQQMEKELNLLAQSVFFDMFGDSLKNEKKWVSKTVRDVSRKVTDGTHQTPEWSDSGIPFLFISNIREGEVNFDTKKVHYFRVF